MRKTVLLFGLTAGAISVGIMLMTVRYINTADFGKSDILGYTSIALSALLVFFGIRSYRENAGGGKLTFGRGFSVGVLISLVSALCYVAAFQILYFKVMPGLGAQYAACMVERAKASGGSAQEVEKAIREAAQFKEMFDRPVLNAALTFAESFPVGFAVSLLSAAVLRKKGAK